MLQSPRAVLIVEKGEPYRAAEVVPLVGDKVLLGRSSEEYQPDLAFESPYVSRQHATIEYIEGAHSLTDLESRHGTHIDGARLAPGEAHDLRDRNRIVLARDADVIPPRRHAAHGTTPHRPRWPVHPVGRRQFNED